MISLGCIFRLFGGLNDVDCRVVRSNNVVLLVVTILFALLKLLIR